MIARFRLDAPLAALALLAAPAVAQESGPAPDPPAVRRALIVCGLPGDDDHRSLYADAVEKVARGLAERGGFEPDNIWVRFGSEASEGDGPAPKASRGPATREALAGDAADLIAASSADDGLWVIVLGHGHLDGRRAHLSLPGPDLSDTEFARLFAGLKAREQVFLVTTSASGFFLRPLAKPGRVAISATEADQEVNETVFPLALAEVLTSPPPEADRDKDGTLSLLEIYLATVANVLRRYIADEDIATEHAQLDDNGDGRPSEVQMAYLPPELGGRFGVKPPRKRGERDKGEEKDEDAEPAEPTLAPKDDGHLASRIRLQPSPTKPAEAAAGEPTKP